MCIEAKPWLCYVDWQYSEASAGGQMRLAHQAGLLQVPHHLRSTHVCPQHCTVLVCHLPLMRPLQSIKCLCVHVVLTHDQQNCYDGQLVAHCDVFATFATLLSVPWHDSIAVRLNHECLVNNT